MEESIRLRLLALATYWLVALSLAWVGGSPWTWLGGGIAATVGHAFSWHRRNRSLGSWSILMVVMVIGLAIIMRSDMLAAFDGNWLPLAHFLLLIQAVASFDARTRGGLYAALFLSGIVLFFASQQAFELSFGIFLIGYAALLMTFLATAYVEDETRKAQTSSPETRLSLFGFWSGIGVTVLALAVLAFLLLPRGESNAVGYQQVSALPITGEPTGPDTSPTTSSQPSISSQPPVPAPSESSPLLEQTPIDAQPNVTGQPGEIGQPSVQGAAEITDIAETGLTRRALLGSNVFSSFGLPAEGDSVVMHVRSPVASYWRGEVFDTFDGTYWKGGKISSGQGAVTRLPGSREYTQTFFIEDSSGPYHQDSGEAKIRESTAGVSRKPSSDGKARGSSSKHLCGLTAWNT